MSDIKTALYDLLAADGTVAGIVSTRIYHQAASTNADLPYIVIQRIGSIHDHHMTAATGLTRPSIQIDCWSTSSTLAQALAEAVREALDVYRGTMGTDSLFVNVASLQGENDDYEIPRSDEEVTSYRVTQDWLIWHAESVPTF